MRRTIPLLVVTALATIGTALIPSSASGAAAATATFSKVSDWGSGFEGRVVVANATTSPLTWNVQFDLPSGFTIPSAWDAVMTRSGQHYTFKAPTWAGALPAGASTSFGFNGNPGSFPGITNCTLNGADCGGGTPPDDTTPPSVPANLKWTATTSSSISLAWNASTDNSGTVKDYRVYEGTTVVATVTGTSTTVSGLSGSSTHTYTVAARDARDNESAKSAGVTATTKPGDTEEPTVPGNLRSTGTTPSSISLAWDASTDNSGTVKDYQVYEGGTIVATVAGTSATISGLAASTSHTYTVVARDPSDNDSAKSAPVTATTLPGGPGDTEAPSVPGNLRSTGTTPNSISLAWNASTDNSGTVKDYRVYEGTSVVATVTGTSATIGGLAPATAHTYTVAARDPSDNESAKSAPVTANTLPGNPGGSYAKVGYFTQWGIYGRAYTVKNLNDTGAAAKLTHINYAFANIHPTQHTCMNGVDKATTPDPQDPNQGDGAGDAWADYGKGFQAGESVDGVADAWDAKLAGNFGQLKKLKVKHPHLKNLISIGGWTFSKFFSDAASTPAKRQAFVKSCVDMYLKGDLPSYSGRGGAGVAAGVFDGIDVDWEWPGAEGHAGNHISPNDKGNLNLLLAEFRTQMDALGASNGKQYLLTAFTPADPVKVDQGWDLSKIFDYLDFANVQGYDFHGAGSDNSWEPNRTGHQGNLYPDADDPYTTKFSVDGIVNYYLAQNVDPRKLTIGLAYYGRGWKEVADGGKRGEWQTANGAAPGDFPSESGTRGYKNIATTVPGCTVHHDEVAIATYCYTGAGGQWWTFDDAWSIGKKTAYIKSKNLLGAMVWEMTGDTGVLSTAMHNGLS